MVNETTSNVRVRVRMNHSNTIKEGWRLGETTVELEFDPASVPNPRATLRYYAELLHEVGTSEAERRNQEDADE